jgi:starvation-inducible DNA-binding protein
VAGTRLSRAATVASNSAVAGFDAGWIADRDVIRAMFEALDGVARGLRPHIDETEKTDLVTQDLLIELVGVLEEARWMWQAQNVGYEPEALPSR